MSQRIFALLLVLGCAVPLLHGQERFETMQVGGNTYSNVLILSKTPADLFFTHALGLSNVKVRDIDDELKVILGYELTESGGALRRAQLKPIKLEVDPRIKELEGRVSSDLANRIQTVARNVLIAVVAVVAVAYLFFCYCCMLICEKAGAPSPFLVWLPGLQLVPLFRAASMPKWTVSALFAPQIYSGMTPYLLPEDLSLQSPQMMTFIGFGALSVIISLITAITWCVRICKARNKSPWLALLLLFPVTSVFTFIYLAFSNGEHEALLPRPSFALR